ncbi:MAG: uracil phosphoribosyltransferase [Oscillospiraceae bacterium]|nr:uracil phosphoribosyltransferase [Oscillospiraceae bacterium]MDD7428960.1 uracil phosphoribosyltransferase [Oscillospiraceae bacterium]MDY2848425.1 uracil phosphoribosyltransferase [Oscillospiraceae bacterium]
MNNVNVIEHPLIQHKISLLRDVTTGSKEFRELVSETAMLICYESLRTLPVKEVDVQTPLGIAKTKVLSGSKLAIVPMLRGGLGMVDGITRLVPAAKVGHIGTFRDPETTNAVDYYCKLPFDTADRDVILADIMLATGVTANKAIQLVKDAGAKSVKFICIIANPEGIAAIEKAHPDVQIYCGAIDEGLNDQHYIVPGLGDAGYRMFGTK